MIFFKYLLGNDNGMDNKMPFLMFVVKKYNRKNIVFANFSKQKRKKNPLWDRNNIDVVLIFFLEKQIERKNNNTNNNDNNSNNNNKKKQ